MSDGLLEFVEQDPDVPFPLGRSVVWHDPQNRQHRALDAPPRGVPRTGVWWSYDVYDQRGSSCTAQSAVGVCRTYPNRAKFGAWELYSTENGRHNLYLRAQHHDPWPGTDYEGSSTDAPFKVLRAEGHIDGWKWVFGVDELREYVLSYGAVSTGTNWYRSMFYPDSKGYIKIVDSQGTAGGHAYRVLGYAAKRNAFRIVNSWSRAWGQVGRCWIDYETMGRLLAEQGEAAVPSFAVAA